ncbi:MAG: DUF389 domain-containing protein [Chloroflexi bacterium]|nr:DUF389 domain-containing protein [Chloroflexota bacterium]
MSFSDEPIIPSNSTPPEHDPHVEAARSRRRRVTRRDMIPHDAEGQAALISALSRRAYPSWELFVFSLACGVVLGFGFLLDSQAVLLLGVLATPLMIPWVGFLLAILTGSPRFLFETFMALVISALLVFIGGLLMGVIVRFIPPYTLTNVYNHSRLWIPELVVLLIGAVTLVASFVRSESKPFLPSVIIAYAFFLPVNAAGFGLGSGLAGIWPQAILVFAAHFAWVSVFGLITLLVLKLRPSAGGIAFSVAAFVLFALILFLLMQPSPRSTADAAAALVTPTNAANPLPPPTESLPPTTTSSPVPASTATPEATQMNLTETVAVALTQAARTPSPVPVTLNVTLPATDTLTATLTLEATPIYGKISSNEGGGANLRQTPNGKYLMTLGNGTIVEVYSDFKLVNGVTWIRIIVTRNNERIEGWLLESTVSYATPEPNFGPSSTPGVTPAP